MRWFRKNGEAPRLLSLSPLRTEGSEAERPSGRGFDGGSKTQQQVRHRSRIGKKNNKNNSNTCVNPSHTEHFRYVAEYVAATPQLEERDQPLQRQRKHNYRRETKSKQIARSRKLPFPRKTQPFTRSCQTHTIILLPFVATTTNRRAFIFIWHHRPPQQKQTSAYRRRQQHLRQPTAQLVLSRKTTRNVRKIPPIIHQ